MKEKLRKYVEDMVRDIPKTRNVVDLKEEIIGNMEERYDDLRAEGYGEQDAFDCTINAMGDIRSLFEEENKENGGGKGEPVMAGERPEKKKDHTVKILVLGAALGGLLFFWAPVWWQPGWTGAIKEEKRPLRHRDVWTGKIILKTGRRRERLALAWRNRG